MTEAFERKLNEYKNKISKEIDEIPFETDIINEKPCKVIVEDSYKLMKVKVNDLVGDMIMDTCTLIDNIKKENDRDTRSLECLTSEYLRMKRELKDLRYCEQFCNLHRADFEEWRSGKEKRDEVRKEMQYRREMRSHDDEEKRRERLMALFD